MKESEEDEQLAGWSVDLFKRQVTRPIGRCRCETIWARWACSQRLGKLYVDVRRDIRTHGTFL